MSLERVRCTLCDVRSGRNVSTSLAIHQSMITNIRIWCTKHPGQMELFMNRDRIEGVQKDLLSDFDIEPVFISEGGSQTLLSSHDKISSYLKTLDIPYSLDGGLVLYIHILKGASGKRRVLFGPAREAVLRADKSMRLTRPISDGQGGHVYPGKSSSSASGPSSAASGASSQGPSPIHKESPLQSLRRLGRELLKEARAFYRKRKRLLRRLSLPAVILALYLFFCLIARPGLMQALYAAGQYGGEVFLYNVTSPWCLPGQKGMTRLAEQQIDALYIQASPYERNASRSLIKLTAFKSISDSRLSKKASLYTDQLSLCLKDLDRLEEAGAFYEEGKYVDAILSLREISSDSLIISSAEDLRYDCYDEMTRDIASPETMEECEEALRLLGSFLTSLGGDETLQWTRDETAEQYEGLVLSEAEDLTEAGDYAGAEALLSRAASFDDSSAIKALLARISSRRQEDFIIASACTAFREDSVGKAREILLAGLEEDPGSQRLTAVLECFRSYKEVPFEDILFRIPQGVLRESFVLLGGKELDHCLLFSKFTEASTKESLTVTASPEGRYQILEGSIYAGKYLEADARIEISGDGMLLYDSGRIYRPSDPAKDQELPFRVDVSGIDQVTLRAYIYKKPSLLPEEETKKALDDTKLCTLVLDDLVFHDNLTEEMIWDAADLPEEE